MNKINIEKLHTTVLGEKRIRRNLNLKNEDIIEWCKRAISSLSDDSIVCKGKNWYIYGDWFILTINVYSQTVITAHVLKPKG